MNHTGYWRVAYNNTCIPPLVSVPEIRMIVQVSMDPSTCVCTYASIPITAGTDATHAEHIETIKSRNYVGVQPDGGFVPGELGMGLVEGMCRHA